MNFTSTLASLVSAASTSVHGAHALLASEGNPLDHVLDKPSALSTMFGLDSADIKLSVVSLVVGGLLTMCLLMLSARRISTGSAAQGTDRYLTKGRLAQLIEVIVQGLREGVLEPMLGKRISDYYLPFFLSLFFFVLTLNLFGLIPLADMQEFVHKLTSSHEHVSEHVDHAASPIYFGGTATASISVTAGLATISFFVILLHSLRELGVKGFLEHMCGGKELLNGPKGLLLVVPILFVVEILGLIIKPAALAIRLFANMLAGHTLLATIFMFTGMALKAGGWGFAAPIGLVSAIFAIAISFLELFVAFLQAFVFMFLTAVFIGMMSHHGDDHGADHETDHEAGHKDAHGHGVAHASAH